MDNIKKNGGLWCNTISNIWCFICKIHS
jgi:hypothetical protein